MRESKHKAKGRKQKTFFDKAPAFRTYVGWPSLLFEKKDVFGLCLTSRKEITITYSRLVGTVWSSRRTRLRESKLLSTKHPARENRPVLQHQSDATKSHFIRDDPPIWNPTVSKKNHQVSVSAFQHYYRHVGMSKKSVVTSACRLVVTQLVVTSSRRHVVMHQSLQVVTHQTKSSSRHVNQC